MPGVRRLTPLLALPLVAACATQSAPASTPTLASTSAPAAASAPALASAPGSTPADDLVGKPAPDFTATAQDGTAVHLAALKGKRVVVYFYPKDETPGCTKEACSFRDSWQDIRS